MPVKFKGTSEYDRKFKWHESYVNHDDHPDVLGPASPAGLNSSKQGNVHEPPLQRKKRSSSQLVQQHSSDDAADDYILLGDQSKFAPSIKYRTKTRNVSSHQNGEANANGKEQPSAQISPPPAPRPVNPPPKVTIDTGAPKQKPLSGKGHKELKDESVQVGKTTENKTKSHRYKSENEVHKQRDRGTQVGKPTVSQLKTGDVSSVEKIFRDSGVQVSDALIAKAEQHREKVNKADKQAQNKQNTSLKKQHSSKTPKMSAEKFMASVKSTPAGPVQSQSAPMMRDNREKRSGSMNEFVQTNMDKGITDSAQEAGVDYGMRYRAGIAPPRRKGPQRKSEYQLQFQWKNPVSSSPLLAAEQMVYKSNTSLTPAKDPMPKVSEYRKQFKPWKMVPVTPDTSSRPEEQVTPSKKAKVQRSKSLEDITTDKLRPAGVRRITSEEDKRLVKESRNPLKLHFPHGKFKNFLSEYASNFKPPAKFAYEAGAWKGADPPHLQPQEAVPNVPAEHHVSDDAGSTATSTSTTNWFSEVAELRQKADEYKKRAQGTHFSREHLVQLYAKQAELWDTVSNSSVLSALSLEEPGTAKKRTKSRKHSSHRSSSSRQSSRQTSPRNAVVRGHHDPHLPIENGEVKRKLAWPTEDEHVSSPHLSSVTSERTFSVHSAGSVRDLPSDGDHTLVDDDEGRVPTPELHWKTSSHRHHLDRTTPAVGGALLTSPPKLDQTSSIDSSSVRPAKQGISLPLRDDVSDFSSIAGQRPHVSHSAPAVMTPQPKLPYTQTNKKKASHTYGMPTRDAHVILDEDVSYDHPLRTSFVSSPFNDRTATRREEFFQRHPGVDHLSTIPEGSGSSYGLRDSRGTALAHDDDDVLSVSMQSVASSCSLASEVLERARQRRDEFWARPSKAGGRA